MTWPPGKRDAKVDIFAAGVLLFEMAAESFETPTDEQGWAAIDAAAVEALPVKVPGGFRKLLLRMANVESAERPTAEDALASLQRLLARQEANATGAKTAGFINKAVPQGQQNENSQPPPDSRRPAL